VQQNARTAGKLVVLGSVTGDDDLRDFRWLPLRPTLSSGDLRKPSLAAPKRSTGTRALKSGEARISTAN
jgi:hypothetical protein